jgi:hypothetical protein
MKKNTTPLLAALLVTFVSFGACKSTKISTKINKGQVSNSEQVVRTTSICDQAIRYYSDKFKMTNDGQEVNVITEIIINPSTKLISLTSAPPNQEKVSFDTVIENFDCNFNSTLTGGQSIYTGYIKQKDGTTTKAVIKVEAKDGGITISSSDPEKHGEFIIIVSKWEVVRE